MKSRQIQTLTVTLSLSLFIFSLTQHVITIEGYDNKSVTSWEYLTMGSVAIFGGGVLEWLIWLANPLYIVSIILFIKHSKLSMITAFIASFSAVLFSTWEEIRTDQNGNVASITELKLGYYLWVSSIIVLTIGIFTYFRHKHKKKVHLSAKLFHGIDTEIK